MKTKDAIYLFIKKIRYFHPKESDAFPNLG